MIELKAPHSLQGWFVWITAFTLGLVAFFSSAAIGSPIFVITVGLIVSVAYVIYLLLFKTHSTLKHGRSRG
ncbi:hypothetical protein [Natrononativus amylolyticus]|uniref:hypothetical protein n=1 Tax=Natrononativus amylolyticus TaxID=2963434 RepID=UPI0020CD3755|nr:hypothetical protein [Natrononativus amylolyticus]